MSASRKVPRQRSRIEFVRLPPDVDFAATPLVRDLLAPNAGGPRQTVVADLSSVSFMDCAGLGVLLEINDSLGGRLRLLDCPPFVSELMHATGTYDAFNRVL